MLQPGSHLIESNAFCRSPSMLRLSPPFPTDLRKRASGKLPGSVAWHHPFATSASGPMTRESLRLSDLALAGRTGGWYACNGSFAWHSTTQDTASLKNFSLLPARACSSERLVNFSHAPFFTWVAPVLASSQSKKKVALGQQKSCQATAMQRSLTCHGVLVYCRPTRHGPRAASWTSSLLLPLPVATVRVIR